MLHRLESSWTWSVCGAAALLASCTLLIAPVQAQTLRENTALKFAPDDASFYGSMLRNREQYEMFTNSKAFKALWNMPMIQEAIREAKQEMEQNDDLQPVFEFFEAPENREILTLLRDAASDEIVMYGDDGFANWITAMNRFNSMSTVAQLEAAQSGEDEEIVIRRKMVEQLEQNPDLLKVPRLVIGFRLNDNASAVAARQLSRLEALVKAAIEAEQPQLSERFARVQLAGGEFLTFKFDGTLVPWDELLKQSELDETSRAQLSEKLQETEAAVTLGIRDGYLLLAVASSNEHLAKLGAGGLLVERAELQKVLGQAEGKRVTSIGFASAEFLRKISATDQQIDQMVDMMKAALPLAPIAQDIKDDLQQDIVAMGDKLRSFVPETGSMASYEFLTDGGYETVAYNWSEQPNLDGSKPLTILDHIGPEPVAFFAVRTKQQADSAEVTAEFCNKLVSYAERIGDQWLNDNQKEQIQRIKTEFTPLLKRLDGANREKFAPAFADGQAAVVLNGSLTAPQWHMMMPPAKQPVPLPQLAMVYGVSDANRVREGAAEYFAVAQQAIQKLAEMYPDQVPPIELAKPTSQEMDSGTIYMYGLAQLVGLSPQISPNAGLSDSFLVMSLAPTTTQQMLETSAIAGEGPLADRDQPLAVAWQVSPQRFVQMVRPWVQYAFDQAEAQGKAVEAEVVEQVNTIMNVIECCRGIWSASHTEDGVLVSRTLTTFEDLP